MTVVLVTDSKDKVLARLSSDSEIIIETVEKGHPTQVSIGKGEMRTLIIHTSYW